MANVPVWILMIVYSINFGHCTTVPKVDPLATQSTLFSMTDFFSYELKSKLVESSMPVKMRGVWMKGGLLIVFLINIENIDSSTVPKEDPISRNLELFAITDFFSYDEVSNLGPRHWQKYWPQCGGKQQSPIDFKSCQIKYTRPFKIYYSDLGRMQGNLMNNAHTAVFYVHPRNKVLSGIPYAKKSDTYSLYSFSFHFGQDLESGSEHSLDNTVYPVEIQLMHINNKYRTMNAAIAHPDGRAILSVFMEVDASSLTEIDRFILEFVSRVIKPNVTGIPADINLAALLPFDGNFFTYLGSMTTPPCDENIRWVSMKRPIKISPLSLLTLYQLKDNHNVRISKFGNARPTQEGNCRLVEANF